MEDRFAKTPKPPYYVVTFVGTHADTSDSYDGYEEMLGKMVELGTKQPDFLGLEFAMDPSGVEVINTYWTDDAAIKAWKANEQHLEAQMLGRTKWYQRYIHRIAKVERDYEFNRK